MNCLSARDEQKQFTENGSSVEHAIATPGESVDDDGVATNHAHICTSHIAQHFRRGFRAEMSLLHRDPFLGTVVDPLLVLGGARSQPPNRTKPITSPSLPREISARVWHSPASDHLKCSLS